MGESWISGETEIKERDFRGILEMHAKIVKGIAKRHTSRPYLYVDLYAGPGHLEYKGRRFDGSPLIARDTLTRIGLPYEAAHFERDPDVADRLGEALWVPASLLDAPDPETSPVFAESCQDGLPRWLAQQGVQLDRYGLVYSDPIRDEIPHELLAAVARSMPRVDILSYVSATQYKRRRGVDPERPLLIDHVRAVGKRRILIRRPHGAWQWTFILWTNWADMPAWTQHEFYPLDSATGTEIMHQLNLSERENRERANTPLPFEAAS